MDLYDPNRFSTSKGKPLPSAERLLGVPPHAPPLENSSPSTADELIEDDVVFFYDDSIEPSSSSSPIPIPTPNHHRNRHRHSPHHKASPFGPPDSFGILAALPENDASPNARNGSPFLHKAPVSVSVAASLSSSSSSSSSRAILAIPRPPSDRTPSSSSFTSYRFHQSAPVNVPAISPAMLRAARRFDEKEAEAAVEALADEEMRPPHEFVSWKNTMSPSPMMAYSVLEGVGRTLKGRDLRQVRNAVLRQTGFIG